MEYMKSTNVFTRSIIIIRFTDVLFIFFIAGFVLASGKDDCRGVCKLNGQELFDISKTDLCNVIVSSHESITSLKDVRSMCCDTLRLEYNELKYLTDEDRWGFPHLEMILADNNSICYVDPLFLKNLKRIELKNNFLKDFPWDYAETGLRMQLAGNTIKCGWDMKWAIERGVIIESAPNCLGAPGKSYREVLEELPPEETPPIDCASFVCKYD